MRTVFSPFRALRLMSLVVLLACGGSDPDNESRTTCQTAGVGCPLACQSDADCGSGFMCGPNGCAAIPRNDLCVDGDANCGMTCEADADCGPGLFCGAAGCAKECVEGTFRCPDLGACMPNGSCESTNAGPPGENGEEVEIVEAPPAGNPEVCASTVVSAEPVKPNVILIVDQSLSMQDPFTNNTSRWDVLRSFLLQQDGLIDRLQDRVRFGLSMYSAEPQPGDNSKPLGECPMVTSVAPALNNHMAIADVYNAANPIRDTPTGDAINAILDDLALAMTNPDEIPVPTVFVLATDGEPDTCEQLNPQNGQEEAIAAVERAYEEDVPTFVISVGQEVSQGHLQDLANAGLNQPASDPAEYWVAGDDETLAEALTTIVGQSLSCEIDLDGSIESGDACEGKVLLNNEELDCNDPNGWELMDDGRIRLVGSACDTVKAGGNVFLEASFPCSVTIIQ